MSSFFGIMSIYSNNYMHLYNGFTWLLISLTCDYNAARGELVLGKFTYGHYGGLSHSIGEGKAKEMYLLYFKNYFITLLLLAMLIFSLFGTLNQQFNDSWCTLVSVMLVISSFLPLVVFGIAMFFYAGRFWDP